jgi:hypothetical protein
MIEATALMSSQVIRKVKPDELDALMNGDDPGQ